MCTINVYQLLSRFHSSWVLLIRFPGRQPVSFSKTDVARLERERGVSPNLYPQIALVMLPDSFWVCKKFYGILFFIQLVEGRHNVYWYVRVISLTPCPHSNYIPVRR